MSSHIKQIDVEDAYKRISPHIVRTPVKTCDLIDQMTGRKVYFKCENLQKTGSFKLRGALNAVLSLTEKGSNTNGVVTHSSGNHALGLSYAANLAGIPCSVVVPNNTPQNKCDKIKSNGADLVFCEPNLLTRTETCRKLSEERGQEIISTCDNYEVIAGQGTIAYEFLDQVPDLDAILGAASGGGMMAGTSISAKARNKNIKVFVVEPFGKGLGPCLRTGKRLWSNPPRLLNSIAEGMRRQQAGSITFDILLEKAEKQVFTVNMVIETSAAAAVAAVLSDKMKKMDSSIKKVGVIVGGGNVDVSAFDFFKNGV